MARAAATSVGQYWNYTLPTPSRSRFRRPVVHLQNGVENGSCSSAALRTWQADCGRMRRDLGATRKSRTRAPEGNVGNGTVGVAMEAGMTQGNGTSICSPVRTVGKRQSSTAKRKVNPPVLQIPPPPAEGSTVLPPGCDAGKCNGIPKNKCVNSESRIPRRIASVDQRRRSGTRTDDVTQSSARKTQRSSSLEDGHRTVATPGGRARTSSLSIESRIPRATKPKRVSTSPLTADKDKTAAFVKHRSVCKPDVQSQRSARRPGARCRQSNMLNCRQTFDKHKPAPTSLVAANSNDGVRPSDEVMTSRDLAKAGDEVFDECKMSSTSDTSEISPAREISHCPQMFSGPEISRCLEISRSLEISLGTEISCSHEISKAGETSSSNVISNDSDAPRSHDVAGVSEVELCQDVPHSTEVSHGSNDPDAACDHVILRCAEISHATEMSSCPEASDEPSGPTISDGCKISREISCEISHEISDDKIASGDSDLRVTMQTDRASAAVLWATESLALYDDAQYDLHLDATSAYDDAQYDLQLDATAAAVAAAQPSVRSGVMFGLHVEVAVGSGDIADAPVEADRVADAPAAGSSLDDGDDAGVTAVMVAPPPPLKHAVTWPVMRRPLASIAEDDDGSGSGDSTPPGSEVDPPPIKRAASLLDSMHKKLYPGQYPRPADDSQCRVCAQLTSLLPPAGDDTHQRQRCRRCERFVTVSR